ncbi:MAG: hypothetical protein IJO27_00260 [Bacilli bacterium]|nr:hypothetical protein [Bacilli bacterium]
MNNFLIPANSKKSMLIFGLFNKVDLIMFGSGLVLTIILLLVLPIEIFWVAIIAVAPGLITGFLVLPVPNYHNMLTVIISAINFLTGRREFIWKGWCYPHGEEK